MQDVYDIKSQMKVNRQKLQLDSFFLMILKLHKRKGNTTTDSNEQNAKSLNKHT